jgi:hypothetical protein
MLELPIGAFFSCLVLYYNIHKNYERRTIYFDCGKD